MATFDSEMRRRVILAGISLHALARAIPVDPSHLARIARGERRPTPELAAAVDRHLGADGQLAALAARTEHAAASRRPLDSDDAQCVRDTIARLVDLDTAHGSAGLDEVAARAFRQTADRLAIAGTTPAAATDLQAAVAELGEVAAWLAYDAEHQDTSRQLAADALLHARLASDTDMERFLLSHLSMQAVYTGRPAEGLAIADRVLAEAPHSRRVEAMFRLRRARALGGLGNQTAALDELHHAVADLADGTRAGDPHWTWWLHDAELAVHEARLRAATGDVRGAVEWSQRAVAALPDRQGRDQALYRAWLLHDQVSAHAWRDAERTASDLHARSGLVGTARVGTIVRATLAELRRPGIRAPRWLRDAVGDLAA